MSFVLVQRPLSRKGKLLKEPIQRVLRNVPKSVDKPSDDCISYMIDDIVRFLDDSNYLKKVKEFSDADLMAFLLFYIYLWMSSIFRQNTKRCNFFLKLYLSTNPNGWEDQHFFSDECIHSMHLTDLVTLNFIQVLYKKYTFEDLNEEECRTIFDVLFEKTGKVDSLEPRFRELAKTLLEGNMPTKKAISKDVKKQVELRSITESLVELGSITESLGKLSLE